MYYLFNSWPSGHLSPLSFGFPDSIRVVSATARQPPGKQEPPRGIVRGGDAPPPSAPSAAGRQPGTEVMRERAPSAFGAGAWWGRHTIQTYLCVRWAAFRQGGGSQFIFTGEFHSAAFTNGPFGYTVFLCLITYQYFICHQRSSAWIR